jgi:RNA polymerase sigma-70 factor (ECF subfamily)
MRTTGVPAEASGSTTLRLLRRAREGDPGALDNLFERVTGPLLRWAHRRLPQWARDGADTADIVQDVLSRAFPRLERFENEGPRALRAYLRQCVRNRIVDEVRRAERHAPHQSIQGVDLPAPGSVLDDVIAAEGLSRYRECLARLPEPMQELIVGRLELGYNFEQLALVTDRRSPDAARMALRRALMQLAEEMGSG